MVANASAAGSDREQRSALNGRSMEMSRSGSSGREGSTPFARDARHAPGMAAAPKTRLNYTRQTSFAISLVRIFHRIEM